MNDKPKDDTSAMNRRDFLKSSTLGAGAAVTLTSCSGKGEKLIPLLVSEESIIPGVDRWTASTCGMCAAGCGIHVRSMLGEAKVEHQGQERRQMILQVKKIEGNPLHPLNRGRVCARGQAGPQILYNPDRIQSPLKRSGPRGSGEYTPVTWDEALGLLESKLKPLVSAPSGSAAVAAIAGPVSDRRRQLLREFLAALGSDHCYSEEPLGITVLREANRRLFGRPELELHDIENARYILSFGADFVESHTSPVRYNLALAHFRQGRPGQRGKFVQVESRFSLTAANSDEWLPSRPGTEAAVALAVAHVLLKEELFNRDVAQASIRDFARFRSWVLERYTPEKVAEAADVPAEKIVRIAREFARHQPGLALAGGSAAAHPHGVFSACAVQSLNALVGNLGRAGGISWTASSRRPPVQEAPRAKLWAEEFIAASENIQVLLLWDANPIYHTPATLSLATSVGRIPFVAAFSAFKDESSTHADLILPDQTFLEQWDVIQPKLTAGSRTLSITQPIVRPMHDSTDRADVLLRLAKRLGPKVQQALPDSDFRDYLKRWLKDENVLEHGSFAENDLESFWGKFLQQGVWTDSSPGKEPARSTATVDLSYLYQAEPPPGFSRETTDYDFFLQPFESAAIGAGQSANLPWLQELPDPMTSVVWGSWLEINPRTAANLGIEDNEVVWVESRYGKIRVPVLLYPAARPDVVSMPFGQGHSSYGRYASGRGGNPWEILSPTTVRDTDEVAWAATRVKITRTGEKARVIKIGYDREHALHR